MEVVVWLGDGRELVVRLDGEHVLLELRDEWAERLSRKEAWDLAEAIDLVSTLSAQREPPFE